MPTETRLPTAWECANCACTNEGIEPGPCLGCGAVDPIRYMIWTRQGGLPAPTAISAQVDRPLQYSLSSIATAQELDVVGIRANNRGRKCPRHDCCGDQVAPRMKLKVLKEMMTQQPTKIRCRPWQGHWRRRAIAEERPGGAFCNRLSAANEAMKNIKIKIRRGLKRLQNVVKKATINKKRAVSVEGRWDGTRDDGGRRGSAI